MAGPVHEDPLAVKTLLNPSQHFVECEGEAMELVTRRWDQQSAGEISRRVGARCDPQTFHRPERSTSQDPSSQRCDREGDHTTQPQQVGERRERIVPIIEGRRQYQGGSISSSRERSYRTTLRERANRCEPVPRLGRHDRPAPQLLAPSDHAAHRVQHLAEVFVGHSEQIDPQLGIRVPGGEEQRSPRPEFGVDSIVRVRAKATEDETPDEDQHQREHRGESQRDARADRQLHDFAAIR